MGPNHPTPGHTPMPHKAMPDDTVKCANCGCMNAPDASYCDQCGNCMTTKPAIPQGR